MHQAAAFPDARPSRLRRLLEWTLVRIVLALFSTALAGGIVAQLVSDHTSGSLHHGWPSLCGGVAALAMYTLYVRLIENRRASELAIRGSLIELGLGLAGGAALVALVVAALALLGVYRFEAINAGVQGLGAAFSQMVFVGVFEELLMRAIILRLIERSLGTWLALAISSALFGLAHLPGSGMGALPFAVAVVAGGFFGAAYLVTRRLWLCIGLHTAWNFTLGSLFSISVSGREPTAGLITGSLSGPHWLTGGSYGLEGSVLTLAVLLAAGTWLLARAA
ncbi:CPBP family intramembrane glutamic endopeptidase [Ideonella sp.]|uniref:CPBP family intramembrane glutamic endopeptidase n=1 Tax=Ideonella sp. TaxID=1929293 RepID=UPI003BB56A05